MIKHDFSGPERSFPNAENKNHQIGKDLTGDGIPSPLEYGSGACHALLWRKRIYAVKIFQFYEAYWNAPSP
jgi:hypothetical protein